MNFKKTTSPFKRSVTIYSAIAIVLLALYYVLELPYFDEWDDFIPFVKKLSVSLFLICLIVILSKIISGIVDSQEQLLGDKYNLLRIIRFLTIVSSIIVVAAFLFQNLIAAAVSFGLISLVLGFALQAPIASFIAWIYLIFRRSYLVGDRIQMKDFRGDVVEISYLDTSILECQGDYLGNDRKSGRIIRFPNSLILKEEIINYSGPQAPFIWNETAVQIAFTSDLEFVERCLLQVAQEDFNTHYSECVGRAKVNLWDAQVYFRNNQYAWMEAVVSYPVQPGDMATRRNRILKAVLPLLNKNPDKVQFPEGARR